MDEKKKNKLVVFYTDHFVNKTLTQCFAKSNNFTFDHNTNHYKYNDIIYTSYGIKRGNDEIFNKFKNFIYIDHGYMNDSYRKFSEETGPSFLRFNGYFRFIRNNFYFNKVDVGDESDRFKKLNITLKDLNKNGEYILLSEPSNDTRKFLNIENWTEVTINEIKKFSDREILIHNKLSKISLNEVLKKAYAFVSCQSTAGFKAIINGIPSYFTHDSMKKYGSIEEINNRKLNHKLLYAAANNQWKISEFFTDEFKIFLSKITT
jgi:hypothetical protein